MTRPLHVGSAIAIEDCTGDKLRATTQGRSLLVRLETGSAERDDPHLAWFDPEHAAAVREYAAFLAAWCDSVDPLEQAEAA
jgi:hypothetical protein